MWGHSMGGAIGIDLATKHSQWMKQLVLITTSAKIDVPQWFLDDLKQGTYNPEYYKLGFAQQDPPMLLDMLMSKVQLIPTEVAYNDFSACDQFDDINKLEKIKAKTLIIGATEDRMMPEGASQVLDEKIRHSSLVMIDGASHFITMKKNEPSSISNQRFCLRTIKNVIGASWLWLLLFLLYINFIVYSLLICYFVYSHSEIR